MFVFRTFDEYINNLELVRSKLDDTVFNGKILEFDREFVIFPSWRMLNTFEVVKIYTDKSKDESIAWFIKLSQACRYVHTVEVWDYDWYLEDSDIPYWGGKQ